MTLPDLINSGFEFWGSVAIWRNVWALHKDKHYAGIRVGPVAFFMAWGFWNIWFYRHLHQYLSWYAGMSITLANVVWLGQMLYYGRRSNASTV